MIDSPIAGLIARSEALRTTGRFDDALLAVGQALAIDPNDFDALSERATVLHYADRESEALETIEKCCAMRPDSEWAHRLRSAVLRTLGRHREAVEAAELAVSIDPNDPFSHSCLAQALVSAGRPKQARQPAAEAVRLSPEMALVHDTQGRVHLANKNFDLAEAALRKALELDPEGRTAKFNLGLALRQQHRADEAIPLARALVLDDPSDVGNVQAMIKSGHEYVRRGPINRAMFGFLRYAFLRVPIVFAALLFPFAMVERGVRRRKLPPGTWEAIQAAKKSPIVKAANRASRPANWLQIRVIVGLLIVAFVLLRLLS